MSEFIRLCAGLLAALFRSRAGLQAENLALRHQLCVYQRSVKRPKVKPADRIMWSLLAKAWAGWRDALVFVKPDTVIRWQRKRFKEHWRKLSQSGEPGRPPVSDEVKELIRTMSSMNPTWGSPRVVGELNLMTGCAETRRRCTDHGVIGKTKERKTDEKAQEDQKSGLYDFFHFNASPKSFHQQKNGTKNSKDRKRLGGSARQVA